MGKKYVIDETTLTKTANKIRGYTGNPNKIFGEDLHYGVDDVYLKGNENGYESGNTDGYNKGRTDGYNEAQAENEVAVERAREQGYNEGKQAEKKAFWDNYLPILSDGAMNQASYLFAGNGWNDDTFYPDRNLVFVGYNSGIFQSNKCTNLRKRFEELNITIGGKNANNVLNSVQSFFRGLSSTELPDLVYFKPTNLQYFCDGSTKLKWIPHYDTSKCTNMYYTFNGCTSLERIEGIDFSSVTSIPNAFTGCTALTSITVYGVIPISISFSACPLSVESMISIITHLKDYSNDATNKGKYTLTLKDTCKTLMAEQGATQELGGKTYDQYITDMGWNLA